MREEDRRWRPEMGLAHFAGFEKGLGATVHRPQMWAGVGTESPRSLRRSRPHTFIRAPGAGL